VLGSTLLWAADKPRIERLIKNARLTRRVVDRFVAGRELDDAVEAIRALNGRGIGGILDLLGEGVSDPEGAQAAAEDYHEAIKRIEESKIDTTVSVKLTQLGLAFDKASCVGHLRRLAAEAEAIGTRVEIDMEQSEHISATLDIYRLLRPDFPSLRLAIQAYLRRTPIDLETMADIKPRIRLVKGAYAEPEAIAYQKRREIDTQYMRLTDWLFAKGTDPALATHDGKLIAHGADAALRVGAGPADYEIQMLYGIRRDLQDSLASGGFRVRIYVPFGSAWYPYLMRRLAERPANIRFFLRALAGR
jgi:proline dehydrogenase